MEAELQFARISVDEFIERIEYRSSLLVQVGHADIDGELQPVYEFRHLTFQEYLVARGLVEEQYPAATKGAAWPICSNPTSPTNAGREVIPLAAVLAGRKAEETVRQLTAACEMLELAEGYPKETVTDPCVTVLRQCLLDEVQVTESTLALPCARWAGTAMKMAGRIGREVARAGSSATSFRQ